MIECVVNVSEGRDLDSVNRLAEAAGPSLLDVHSDPHHNRSVLTLAGARVTRHVRNLARLAVEILDIRHHEGAHPFIGALDVVPFVVLEGDPAEAIGVRDAFAKWAGAELGLPCFLYGPERSLPELRREAWRSLAPSFGPACPHPTAGACAVGAREVLVAYNVWLEGCTIEAARRVAKRVRGPVVRALGMELGGKLQVSCNLLSPAVVGPAAIFDAIAQEATVEGCKAAGAELVGLIPMGVLLMQPEGRWEELDLSPERTIEHRLEERLGKSRKMPT